MSDDKLAPELLYALIWVSITGSALLILGFWLRLIMYLRKWL